MSSKILTVIACIGVVLGVFWYKNGYVKNESGKITIGIIQTASHPALDHIRQGFITELQRLSQGKIDCIVQNGEGSLPQIQAISANFHARKQIQAIFAIATPAVQAITRVEKDKPVFIAAVSDPESLGLNENNNVCGTTDRIDTEAQSHVIKELLPQAKRAVILYNPGESNSVAMVAKMKSSLEKVGIDSTLLGVHVESEIAIAVQAATRKGDFILVPADNLLVGAMPLVAHESLYYKCPLIVSDIPSVAKGALAATGADYRVLGEQTACLAYQVLMKGKSSQDIGIHDPLDRKTVVNQKTADALPISIPRRLAETGQLIGNGEGV